MNTPSSSSNSSSYRWLSSATSGNRKNGLYKMSSEQSPLHKPSSNVMSKKKRSNQILSSASVYTQQSQASSPNDQHSVQYSNRKRIVGPLYYEPNFFWGNLSVVLFSNLLGLVLGSVTQSYAVFNACSIPLCLVLLALPPLASPHTKSRKQFSAVALLLYAGRTVMDHVLDHAFVLQTVDTSRVSLHWVSFRMLILYAAVSVLWSILSLLPFFIGSMSNALGNKGFTYTGFALVLVGLVLQTLPDDATTQFLHSQMASSSTSAVNCFRMQVIGGEFLFWMGVTIMNAPALMGPRHNNYPHYHYEQPSDKTANAPAPTSSPSFLMGLFVLLTVWACVSTPSSLNESVATSGLTAHVPNEWRMTRTLLLTRHGFLQHQSYRSHEIRGPLGRRHQRVHLNSHSSNSKQGPREHQATHELFNSTAHSSDHHHAGAIRGHLGHRHDRVHLGSHSHSGNDSCGDPCSVFFEDFVTNHSKTNATLEEEPVAVTRSLFTAGFNGPSSKFIIDLDQVFDYSF